MGLTDIKPSPGPSPVIVIFGGQSNARGTPLDNSTTIDTRVAFIDGQQVVPAAQALALFFPFKPDLITAANPTSGAWLPLGTSLATATGRPVIMGLGAISGSAIVDWDPTTGANRTVLSSTIAQSLTMRPTDVKVHFVWIQGETEAGMVGYAQATYQTQLAAVVAGVRALYPGSIVHVHVILLNINDGALPSITNVRAAQTAWVLGDAHATLISMDDITPSLGGVHYDVSQFVTMAARLQTSILASDTTLITL